MACNSRSFHFVLVHGACFGGWCWYKVADFLMKEGYTVSALDMAGQGIHPADADHISTIEEYNQPLTDFFNALPFYHKITFWLASILCFLVLVNRIYNTTGSH
ncbi:hypothetical protein SUGI_0221500 [Cryptomeria japonica]|nr:hypothetical protein SUGI_0221500 [Cryptomeria japonica]